MLLRSCFSFLIEDEPIHLGRDRKEEQGGREGGREGDREGERRKRDEVM
jgi:hypothetical protein